MRKRYVTQIFERATNAIMVTNCSRKQPCFVENCGSDECGKIRMYSQADTERKIRKASVIFGRPGSNLYRLPNCNIKYYQYRFAELENHIIVYLRACKFSLEKTKEAIDLNFTIRARYPDFFGDRRLDTITKTVKNLEMALMPERDKDGNVVICYRLKSMDLSEWSYAEFTKLSMMSQDVCNWELGSAPGYVFVHDIKNLTFSQIIQSPINFIAASLRYSQEASACSIRGIHIMNGGTIFEKLFAVLKPFLNQEVIDVMKIHPNYEDLVSAIGAQAVPKDYGGNAQSIQEGHDEMIKLIEKYQDALIEEEKYRADEKKRPEGNKAGDFGIQGSFRKIEVD